MKIFANILKWHQITAPCYSKCTINKCNGQVSLRMFYSKQQQQQQQQQQSNTYLTVDDEEVDHFRSYSDKWYEEEFLPLRKMNKLRVPFIEEPFCNVQMRQKQQKQSQWLSPLWPLLQQTNDYDGDTPFTPLAGVKLLDIGCGGGILAEELAQRGALVTAIDPVEENIKIALAHSQKLLLNKNPNSNMMPNYKACTIEEWSTEACNQNAFDGVIASEVVEHVDNVEHFIQCAIKCLRPGGFLFITTVNQTLFAYWSIIVYGENISRMIPKGTHKYQKFVPTSSLCLMLNTFNCDVVKVHGMFCNPFTVEWSWTQNQWMSYAVMATKRT